MQDPIVMAWRCIHDAFYSRNHFALLWCQTKYSRGLHAIAGGYHPIGLRASARPNATYCRRSRPMTPLPSTANYILAKSD